jgi:hypothetical protein
MVYGSWEAGVALSLSRDSGSGAQRPLYLLSPAVVFTAACRMASMISVGSILLFAVELDNWLWFWLPCICTAVYSWRGVVGPVLDIFLLALSAHTGWHVLASAMQTRQERFMLHFRSHDIYAVHWLTCRPTATAEANTW